MRFPSIYAVLIACFICAPSNAQQPIKNLLQKCFGAGCQRQSVQGFGFDTDGAVITSVGVPVSKSPTNAPVLQSTAVVVTGPSQTIVEGRKERKASKDAIIEGLAKALDQGKITQAEFQVCKSEIRWNPFALRQVEQFVAAKAIAEGYNLQVDANGDVVMAAIPWADIADFIVKIAPFIFKLIEMLAFNPALNVDWQYTIVPVVVCDWSGIVA